MSKTCTAALIEYTTGGKYQTFNNLNNAKTVDNNYAECHVGGKNASLNRPSTLTFHKFQANLPTGAMVTKITVKYKHSKAKYNNKDCNVQSPTITLMNSNSAIRYGSGDKMQKKGQAPTSTATERQVVFNSNAFNLNVINSNNFGVRFDYPTNANNNEGYVRLYYLKIIIEYKTSKYSVGIKHWSGEYNGDKYIMTLDVSNKNLTKYSPTVTFDAPEGFSLLRHQLSGGGVNDGYRLTSVSARVFTIVPDFSKRTGTRQIILTFDTNITYPTGQTTTTGTFTAVESLNGASGTKTVTIDKDRPLDPSVDTTTDTSDFNQETSDGTETFQTITVDDVFDYTITIDDVTWDDLIQTIYNWGIEHDHWSEPLEEVYDTILSRFMVRFGGEIDLHDGTSFSKNHHIYTNRGSREHPEFQDMYLSHWFSTLDENDRQWPLQVKGVTVGYDEVYGVIYSSYYDDDWEEYCFTTWKFVIRPKEEDLTTPFLTLLQLTDEEMDRIGDGCVYKIQSFLKEVTSDEYVRDWYKNFRIGIYNDPIENVTDYSHLTVTQIFQNAGVWSNHLTAPNTFENIECEFRYNDDYPLYILLVGDYMEATNQGSLKFTEPCIIESDYYENWQTNGNYPRPIDELVTSGTSSELSISALGDAETLVFYNLPLDEDYGTNTEMAIRGLEVNGTMEQYTENLVLYATLKSANGESRQRSIVLDADSLNEDNVFSIGKMGDLWGFSTLDMVELEDWEIHLTASNALNEFDSHINFGNVQVILYIEKVEKQLINCYVEGEDLSYYGAFIRDVNIPPGLKTDTDYITVDGTDINDPYRQNIREKTIEIELDIGDCDLESSTLSLKELTRLLTNKRDQYNRPIPKKIEFSHYPDVYWEYIMEETPTTDIEISTYVTKVKLIVPAGTSYADKSTITNTTGYVSGLAAVRPIIQIIPKDTLISIKETVSEQEFHMGYDGDWTDKIVEIDCDDRIVWLKSDETDTDPKNISKYVDINSDWFVLFEDYQFESIGCTIRTVDYTERG